MSGTDFVFDIALGTVQKRVLDGATIKVLMLKTADADATLCTKTTVAAILAATNVEANATNYVRKTLASLSRTVGTPTNTATVDSADVTWTALGASTGGTNNTIVKFITYHDVDGTDANAVPLTAHNVNIVTDGNDYTEQIQGFQRSTAV